MANDIQYTTREKVIEYNLLALTFIKVKKADQPKVLSNHAINSAIEECRQKGAYMIKQSLCLKALSKSTHSPAAIEEQRLLLQRSFY